MTDLSGTREEWLAAFSAELYGPIPPPPGRLSFTREKLPDANAERVVLDLDGFTVDAALWLPENPKGIVTVVDFIGPIGTLMSDAFPIDPNATIVQPPWRAPAGTNGPLDDAMRGASRHRVPVELILSAGWGVISTCYGSWVPDDRYIWRDEGLMPRLNAETRAISLWAWAYSRLVDAARQLGHTRIAAAGHSRLGKAALWAAANDTRIIGVLSNDSGAGGASLAGNPAGETLGDLHGRFPHWVLSAGPLSVDQHQLLAAIAPRGLYVASAANDAWADPVGERMALDAAAEAWGVTLPPTEMQPGDELVVGSLGWHLRPGGHELLPYDWRRFLSFLDQLPA
jgi:hypothetical protein